MKKYIQIDSRPIGRDYSPFIIAELSANHNGKLENALKIIDAAKSAGADAVKLQSYTPDTITMKSNRPEFQIEGGLWDGKTLYDLYEWAHMPWDWHEELFNYAKSVGITIFSSPFDFSAVDMLEKLNAPAYKIASFEVIDLPLIRYVARLGKPMIISTGMANETEINEAIEAAHSGGCDDLVILHCVSGYPAPPEDYNLRTIPDIANRFNVLTGLSDHTIDNTTAITSVALGATVIEKHVTLDRNGGGPDDSFSLVPSELAELCKGAKIAWESLGKVDYGQKESEKGNVQFRRSLYVVKDIATGEEFTHENVRSIRPGCGLLPKYLEEVIGQKATEAIPRGTPLNKEHYKK